MDVGQGSYDISTPDWDTDIFDIQPANDIRPGNGRNESPARLMDSGHEQGTEPKRLGRHVRKSDIQELGRSGQPTIKESLSDSEDEWETQLVQGHAKKAAFKNDTGDLSQQAPAMALSSSSLPNPRTATSRSSWGKSEGTDMSIRQPTVIGRSKNLSSPPRLIQSRNPFRMSGKQAKTHWK
jgi:hypothetical protein